MTELENFSVVVADDHPVFRRGIVSLLALEDCCTVVGEAGSGVEAVEVVRATEPDVVLMDLHMPGGGGIEATREIARALPETGVLVLTMADDEDSVFAAMRAGARGYVLKDAEPGDLVRAVEAVGRGEAIFGPGVAERVMRFFSATSRTRGPDPFPQLTSREREVLELLASGLSNSEITRRLTISPKTVRNHVSSILTKLCVTDRSAAIVRAREQGLGSS